MTSKLAAFAFAVGALTAESFALGNKPGFEREIGSVVFYNYDEREAARNVPELELPSATVFKLSAFAVGKITGVVPVSARYFDNRPAFIDCDFTVGLNLPFEAESVIHMGDVTVKKSEPDSEGRYDATATVSGNYELFNPRFNLAKKATQTYKGDWGACKKSAPGDLINNLWQLSSAASATAAECLIYPEGKTAEAAKIRKLYDDGLAEDIKALMPNLKTLTIDRSSTASTASAARPYKTRLTDKIKDIKNADSNITINAKPVQECQFEKLTVDAGIVPDPST
ncbi:MAG: hypothetical protein V4702_02390 [Patescibacteria group bacterium]